jgi:ribonuclease R
MADRPAAYDAAVLVIDAASTRDADDAVAVRRTDAGWRLQVAIADPSEAVPAGSPLDEAARVRGATRYGPLGPTVRMLPRWLSEERLTLHRPGAPALVVELDIDAAGRCELAGLRPGTVEEPVRLTYEETGAILAGRTEHPAAGELRELWELAELLLAGRRQRGALAIYDMTRGVATDEEGALRELDVEERHPGHLIVQEAMVAANAALAAHAVREGLPLLYRNHAAAPAAPSHEVLQRDIQLALEHPEQAVPVIERMALVLRPAVYAPRVEGHFGLNLPVYAHCTSPLRRYADLVNARQLHAWARGEAPPAGQEELEEVGEALTTLLAQQRAAAAERHRRRQLAIAARSLERGSFDTLDPEAFHRALKVARKTAPPSPALAAELEQRRADGRLAARDAHRILFGSRSQPTTPAIEAGWRPEAEATLAWLAAHPAHAQTVLATELINRGWGAVRVDSEMTGPAHLPAFTVRARVAELGAEAAVEGAPTKKLGQQLAAVLLVADLAGLPRPPLPELRRPAPDPAPAPEAGATASSPDGEVNPVSALNELSQRLRTAAPRYAFAQEGPPHAPRFTCRVELELPDGVRAADAEGASKAEAKRAAALRLLAELGHVPAG